MIVMIPMRVVSVSTQLQFEYLVRYQVGTVKWPGKLYQRGKTRMDTVGTQLRNTRYAV